MATAATLSILVEANTSSATSNLRSVQSTLNRTGSSARTATTHTDRFSSASSKLGSTLSNAAKAAGAAALAYISIAQARDAISTTEDLAKSTLTLHKNLGLSIKTSSEWAAVAKVRGVATTQLGMAFKTLATQVESAKDGSTTAKDEFDKLGISMDELRKMNTADVLLAVSDGIRQLGAGTERTAIASRLFGRGWQTIVPVLRDGSKALKEQLDLANKYGATFGGKSIQSIKDLIAAQRELQFAQLGLQITFTEKVAPALMTAGLAVAHFLNQMRRGKGAGADFRDALVRVGHAIGDVFNILQDLVRVMRPFLMAGVEIFKLFADNVRHIVVALGDVLNLRFGKALGELSGVLRDTVRHWINIFMDLTGPVRHIVAHIGEIVGEGFSKMWHGVVSIFHRGAEGVRSVIHSMGEAIQNVMNSIRKVFHGVASVVRTVVHFIVNAVNKAVSALGSLKDKIPDITPSIPSLPSIPGVPSPGDIVGAIPGLNRGGPVPGAGNTDTVPAMLTPGEFVVRKEQAAKHRQLLEAINFQKYAKGGAVGGFGGMQPAITALAKTFINRFGGYMSSGFRPGDPGFHGRGLAADIVPANWGGATAYANQIGSQLLEGIHQGPPGSNVSWDSGHQVSPAFWGAATWAEHVSHIHLAVANAIKGAIGGAMAQIPNIAKHIQGAGPLAGMARGAAKKMRGAANAYLAKIAPAISTDTAVGSGTLSPQEFLRIANAAIGVTHSPGFTASGLLTLAEQESGLRVNPPPPHDINWPNNPSMGLMQLTGSNFSAYHQPGTSSSITNPLANIAASINYQKARYGHQVTFSPYRLGGMVMPPFGGSFGGGGTVPGPIGAPRTIVAHGGEDIGKRDIHLHVHVAPGSGASMLDDRIDARLEEGMTGQVRLTRQIHRMKRR